MSGDTMLTVEGLTKMLINPFYAITIHEGLYGDHEPLVSKVQWVRANMNLLNKLGAEAYLSTLLNILEGDFGWDQPNNDMSATKNASALERQRKAIQTHCRVNGLVPRGHFRRQ